jgi:hypothetical protein
MAAPARTIKVYFKDGKIFEYDGFGFEPPTDTTVAHPVVGTITWNWNDNPDTVAILKYSHFQSDPPIQLQEMIVQIDGATVDRIQFEAPTRTLKI